jgi:hypothetical protein
MAALGEAGAKRPRDTHPNQGWQPRLGTLRHPAGCRPLNPPRAG